MEREWKHFIDQAIILDHEQIQGTGPTAFGGFSFDPLKEKTIFGPILLLPYLIFQSIC